jgi:threonine/homoserine/homoserine lactone efflux protein
MISTLPTIFASSFIIALSGAMMPGPLLTATISESSQRGFIMGPLLIVGHGILELALVIALLLGLAPFLQHSAVFVTTALAGAVILICMAFGMFRSLPTLRLQWDNKNPSRHHPFVSGLLMSAANPYWTIWWATIGLGYILYSWRFGLWGVAFFFAGHILADLVWYSIVAAAVAGGRRFLTDRIYRGLIACCAVFLVLFAGYFAYAGFRKWFVVAG